MGIELDKATLVEQESMERVREISLMGKMCLNRNGRQVHFTVLRHVMEITSQVPSRSKLGVTQCLSSSQKAQSIALNASMILSMRDDEVLANL